MTQPSMTGSIARTVRLLPEGYLTTREVMERLKRDRGIDKDKVTIERYCRQGRFTGAEKFVGTHGEIWGIPEQSLKTFQEPQMGYPTGKPRASTQVQLDEQDS